MSCSKNPERVETHLKNRPCPYKVVLAALLMLSLAGCLVPEKFTSDAVMNRDRHYAFNYSGTMVHVPYRMEKNEKAKAGKETSAASAAREAEMAKLEKQLQAKDGGAFRKVRYLGNGVFVIEYSASGVLTKPYYFPGPEAQIIRFVPEKNGTVTVQGSGKDKDWAELKKLGLEVKGVFSLTTDAEVLEHNAGKTPGLLSKAYVWEIGPGNPVPRMILKAGG